MSFIPPTSTSKELSRSQNALLRSTLLGGPSSSRSRSSSFCSGGGGCGCGSLDSQKNCPMSPFERSSKSKALAIYRTSDIQNEPKVPPPRPVTSEELEQFKTRRLSHIFVDGEEKLQDLKNGLTMVAPVPVPEIEEMPEDRYNRLYPPTFGPLQDGPNNSPFLKTTGTEHSDEEVEEADYDLDEQDEEFLTHNRNTNISFNVTKTLFETVIAWFLSNKMETKEDFQCMKENLRDNPLFICPNPLSHLSNTELDIIIAYFLRKNQTQPNVNANANHIFPAWQPNHFQKSLSPLSVPYKIFRQSLPKVEPKFLRSHEQSVSFAAAQKLRKKATGFSGFMTDFGDDMQQHSRERVATRNEILQNLIALEQGWDRNGFGQDALDKFTFKKKKLDQEKWKDGTGDNDDDEVHVVDSTGNKLLPNTSAKRFQKVEVNTAKMECSDSTSGSGLTSASNTDYETETEDNNENLEPKALKIAKIERLSAKPSTPTILSLKNPALIPPMKPCTVRLQVPFRTFQNTTYLQLVDPLALSPVQQPSSPTTALTTIQSSPLGSSPSPYDPFLPLASSSPILQHGHNVLPELNSMEEASSSPPLIFDLGIDLDQLLSLGPLQLQDDEHPSDQGATTSMHQLFDDIPQPSHSESPLSLPTLAEIKELISVISTPNKM